MNLNTIDKISRTQWMNALKVKGIPDDRLTMMLDEAEQMIKSAAIPKATYRLVPIDDFNLIGVSINKHLEDCQSVAVMAVTLGAGIDMLLRRVQVTDMAMADRKSVV